MKIAYSLLSLSEVSELCYSGDWKPSNFQSKLICNCLIVISTCLFLYNDNLSSSPDIYIHISSVSFFLFHKLNSPFTGISLVRDLLWKENSNRELHSLLHPVRFSLHLCGFHLSFFSTDNKNHMCYKFSFSCQYNMRLGILNVVKIYPWIFIALFCSSAII